MSKPNAVEADTPKPGHTPDDWDCDSQYAGPALIPWCQKTPVLCIMAADGDVAYIANWREDVAERERIARLIAAASDLLAACEAALHALQHEDDECTCADVSVCPRCAAWCDAMDAAEAALAKAKP